MALEKIFIHKKAIDQYLTTFLFKKKATLGAINSWGKDSIVRLLPFITAGKSIRGCLSLYSYLMLSKDNQKHLALPIAAALELIHTGGLIHDDIMDGDTMRRHLKTIHTQFETFSPDKHFGESMAINIGDTCYFLAFEQLSKVISPNASQIIALACQEYAKVTAAQQYDVASSYLPHVSTAKEILSLYRTKTARYTFSLPLMMGALLSNSDETTLKTLEDLGETIGILYQIRDDELGIIGDPQKTGKPTGTDEANNKQTLIQLYLKNERANDYTKSDTYGRIQTIKNQYRENAIQAIDALLIEKKDKQTLIELAIFCGSRES